MNTSKKEEEEEAKWLTALEEWPWGGGAKGTIDGRAGATFLGLRERESKREGDA